MTLEVIRIAGRALAANKTRGILTTLGIIIGIVGVVTTMTAANGLGNSFKESVSALGSDVVYVSRQPWVMRGRWFEFRNRPNVTLREATALARRLEGARAVNPTIDTERPVKFQSETLRRVRVIGTTEMHLQVSSAVPEHGRFLSSFDVAGKRRVAVIGHQVRETLFGKADPLNQVVHIGPHEYRVVGVMEKQGSAGFFGGPDFDSQVFIPITSFTRSFGGRQGDINIAVKAPPGDGASLDAFQYSVIGEMRKLRKLRPAEKDDFSINQMDSLVAAFNSVMGTVVAIGMVITGISLLVGGIGVMNIMFVSVTERTREIGVRKALGARSRTILGQFLLESSSICLAGGAIGLLLAYGVTEVIARTLLPASISPAIVVLALLVSALVGVVSGIVPAYRAARLDPIEALRYE